jgi:hypothetical protein
MRPQGLRARGFMAVGWNTLTSEGRAASEGARRATARAIRENANITTPLSGRFDHPFDHPGVLASGGQATMAMVGAVWLVRGCCRADSRVSTGGSRSRTSSMEPELR